MASKSKYHHGDLRAALVGAGLELTREGGPEALTVRAATRRAGVSPNAAYRHFSDREALLEAVAHAIEDGMGAGMAASVEALRGGTPAARAWARLRAVGLDYIDFALTEPGWFSVVFFGDSVPDPDALDDRVSPPYLALVEALDELAAAGALSPQERDGAEWPCWAAVHGFAELAVRGPLRGTEPAVLRRHAARTVEAIIDGLGRARGSAAVVPGERVSPTTLGWDDVGPVAQPVRATDS